MPTPKVQHSMEVRDLSLQVRLGCTPEERAVPQEIRVSLDLRFHEAPPGVKSDLLEETVCYAVLSEAFRRGVDGQEFSLVEKIAGDLFEIADGIIQSRALFSLSVHKVKPPVAGLSGGVVYRLGNLI